MSRLRQFNGLLSAVCSSPRALFLIRDICAALPGPLSEEDLLRPIDGRLRIASPKSAVASRSRDKVSGPYGVWRPLLLGKPLGEDDYDTKHVHPWVLPCRFHIYNDQRAFVFDNAIGDGSNPLV